MARHQSFEDIADEAMKANKWPKYWTSNGMQKSQLLREIGGFSQKEYLAGFYTSMLHRQEQDRHAPKTVQGPDEEFVKEQKKKLRSLMFHKSEMENRKRAQL